MKKILLVLLAMFVLTGCAKDEVKELTHVGSTEGVKYDENGESGENINLDSLEGDPDTYTDSLYQNVDYGDDVVYVIGHASPDTDTVTSAISMAYLLNQLGINAQPAVVSHVNKETAFVLSELGVEEPEILEDASGKNLWLVDHTAETQMVNGADEANIVGVIDHHAIGGLITNKPVNIVASIAGSTSSLVYREFERCNVEIPENMAGIMLAGLLSDTNNLASDDIAYDIAAKENLQKMSNIDADSFFENMLRERLSYDGMTDAEIYYHDYKEYVCNDVNYGIGCIEVYNIDDIKPMSDRMQEVINKEKDRNGCDIIFFMVVDVNYSKEYIGYAGMNDSYATKIFEAAFGTFENCTLEDGMAIFQPSVSRKTVVAPAIDSAILSQ